MRAIGAPDDLLFTMTMISKRREAGEDVDVMELFPGVARSVLDRHASACESDADR